MDARTLLNRLRQRWLMCGLLVFFLALSAQYTRKVAHNPEDHRSAVMRWRGQINALAQGVNIWDAYIYPNPPIMALLLSPLLQLPPVVGCLLWYYLKCAMALAALHWTFRMVQSGGRPMGVAAMLVAILFALRPMVGDLTHGNINLFILFLVVAGLYAYYRRRDASAGVLLALAIACKVTPALFIPYFVWKRAWRVLAGCIAGLVLFFGLLPGLFLGVEASSRYHSSWLEKMIWPYVLTGQVTSEHNNQSLPGLVYRLASHSPSFSDDHETYVPLEYHNLANLEPAMLSWILKGAMAFFVVLVIWSCSTPTTLRAGWPLLAEFSLIVLGMLLFSERTWKHHCVTLLLPFTVISYVLLTSRPGRKLTYYLVSTLLGVGVLMLLTGTGFGADRIGKLAQVYGAYVWAYVLLSAAMIVLLRRQRLPQARLIHIRASVDLRRQQALPTRVDSLRPQVNPLANSPIQ